LFAINHNFFTSQILIFLQNLFPDASRITFPNDMKTLMEVVRVKEKAKRPLCRSSLEICPGIKIAVGVYSLARTALPPKEFSVNERNNEVVTKTVNAYRAVSHSQLFFWCSFG